MGTKNPYRFQARWRDTSEGSPLTYFRARYYSPTTGRFTTRDPIGVWGDPGQFGNGYGFCGNNGVNGVDPFGLEEEEGGFGSRVWGSLRAIGNALGSGVGLVDYNSALQDQYNPLLRAKAQGGAVEVATDISFGVATAAATIAGGLILLEAGAPLAAALIPAEVAVPASLILSTPAAAFTGYALGIGAGIYAAGQAVVSGLEGDWQGVGSNLLFAAVGLAGLWGGAPGPRRPGFNSGSNYGVRPEQGATESVCEIGSAAELGREQELKSVMSKALKGSGRPVPDVYYEHDSPVIQGYGGGMYDPASKSIGFSDAAYPNGKLDLTTPYHEAGHYLGGHSRNMFGTAHPYADEALVEAEASLLGMKLPGAPREKLWKHAIGNLLRAK